MVSQEIKTLSYIKQGIYTLMIFCFVSFTSCIVKNAILNSLASATPTENLNKSSSSVSLTGIDRCAIGEVAKSSTENDSLKLSVFLIAVGFTIALFLKYIDYHREYNFGSSLFQLSGLPPIRLLICTLRL